MKRSNRERPPFFCPSIGEDPIREELERMIEHDRKEDQAEVGPRTEDEHRERNTHGKRLLNRAEVTGYGIFAIQPCQTRGEIDQERNCSEKSNDAEKDLNGQ